MSDLPSSAAVGDNIVPSKVLAILHEQPATVQVHRGHNFRHTKIPMLFFQCDPIEQQVVVDPVTLRVYFGLPLKAFELFTNFYVAPSFQKIHVTFDSSQMGGMDLLNQTCETAQDANGWKEAEFILANCCNLQDSAGLRSFEFIFPHHRLPNITILVYQCDHLKLRMFDAPTFSLVTSLTLSEVFLKINEPWTQEMLQHFQNSPGKLTELSLPLPLYVSTDLVTGITGFLRGKDSQMTVTFTNIALKLEDEAYRGLSPGHVAAVQDLLITAGEKKVSLGCLDSGALEELLRVEWNSESTELRKTLGTD